MMNDQNYYSFFVLYIHRLIQRNEGFSSQSASEMQGEIKQQQPRIAGLQQDINLRLHRKVASWLGVRMTEWGLRLQSHGMSEITTLNAQR
jgi:hypothetical protein